MSLVFKPYDPVSCQQRARQRRQKRSAGHSTFIPSSATCINTPPPQFLVAGPECSRVDEKVIPSTNPDGPEGPYSGYPSVEEILEFCSSLDTDVSSVYTPTSASQLSYPDSAIDVQDVSSDSIHQEETCKDDQLRRKLLRAIATMPPASESNTGREAYNANSSSTPECTIVSAWERDTGESSAEPVWPSDAETPPSTASSINTPASATSRTYEQQTCTWRNQDSFVNSEDDAQDSSFEVADLSVTDDISTNALSRVGLTIVQSEDNIAPEPLSSDSSGKLLNQDIQALRVLASAATTMAGSVTEPSVTEPSSAKRAPTQGDTSSSTKRSFSESGATSSVVCNSSKRLRVASTSTEEAVSLLLEIQKMISNVLAKLDQEQPQSPVPDPSAQPIYETIQVAMDEGNDISSDDSSEIGIMDDTDSETESAIPQRRGRQHRSTQRRRWTELEEDILRRLKGAQKRNGMPSDGEIARKLDRTESGVKQHWDIMLQKKQKEQAKH
ncbi:uncharacterized protein FTOL_02098 [Fusarium torulosum]|uniref:Myb-like domain-containing protein n=1 Tax=Fusarium torulosum TaxID=33205 RepID=A0AAE8M1B6_9HYPO|nr:uncharacterized protein FTOL_02098 [Fusarium torulosum]